MLVNLCCPHLGPSGLAVEADLPARMAAMCEGVPASMAVTSALHERWHCFAGGVEFWVDIVQGGLHTV